MHTIKPFPLYSFILPVIAAAGTAGIRPIDIAGHAGLPYVQVCFWLSDAAKKGVRIKRVKHRYYITALGKTVASTIPAPTTSLAPIILPVIGKVGPKGISPKEMEAATKLPRDICIEWLRRKREVDKLKNGRYVLTDIGEAACKKITVPQKSKRIQKADILDF